jgi:hypothetical protein
MDDPTDYFSKTGRTILELNPQAYATLVPDRQGIVQAPRCAGIGAAARAGGGGGERHRRGRSVLSALWLWHDYLDESHIISQKIDTPTGSFWHAIMHRREGDFSNSKYWYARCADHPALGDAGGAGGIDRASAAGGIRVCSRW